MDKVIWYCLRITFLSVLSFLVLPSQKTIAQSVGINNDGAVADPSAILDVKSSTKGMLLPRMTSTQRMAIATPAAGLEVFDTNTGSFWYYGGTAWVNMASSNWSVTGNAGTNPATQFIGTTDNVALLFKVNNQLCGKIGPAAPYSTSWGYQALNSNTNGAFNTAVGYYALQVNTAGTGNTAIGAFAMSGAQGSYNTAIGLGADVVGGSTVNSIALGSNVAVNTSNTIRLGNAGVTVIEGQVPFTTPSDGRYKYAIKEDVKGLDFILHLRPVTYQFDVKRFDEQLHKNTSAAGSSATPQFASLLMSNTPQASYDKATAIRRTGFIAQEVEKAAIASGYDFSGIIKPATADDHYSLSYESFVVPLVKAVQELDKKIELLEKENKALQQQVNVLKKRKKA